MSESDGIDIRDYVVYNIYGDGEPPFRFTLHKANPQYTQNDLG